MRDYTRINMGEHKKINMKMNNGITIVALVITIIIMLILAGVTIKGITADNGLIGRTKESKKLAEIDSEKEEINLATVNAMNKGKYGSLEEKNLEEALKNKIGEGQTEVIKDDKNFVVKIEKSNRYYRIDEVGNVDGPIEIIIDEMPGDITKGNKEAGKTEENPYIINCIEDLVAVSIATNGGNTELEIEMKNGDKMKGIPSNSYKEKYIALNRTLDFNSELSYTNPERTDFGDINQDGKIENIKTELTTGKGFFPIGILETNVSKPFEGNFDGKNNTLKNINVNRDNYAGLFGFVGTYEVNPLIKNLKITGKINSKDGTAGGIVARSAGVILENCENNVEVSGKTVGGLIGYKRYGSLAIRKCKNYGIVTGTGEIGGIAGYIYDAGTIENCNNLGTISGKNVRWNYRKA